MPFTSTTKTLLELNVALSVLKTPGLVPGLTVPPEAALIAATIPVPPSVPPETEAALFERLPVTSKVPAETVVEPVSVLLPESVNVPAPSLTRLPLPAPMTPPNVVEELSAPA